MAFTRALPWLRFIAANVHRLRRRAGLTQEQLAEAANVDARYVQEIERARTNLSVAVLVAVADALDVDPRRLMRPAEMPVARTGRPPRKRPTK